MMVRNVLAALVIAMLLPLAAYADCGSCKSKCNTCVKSSCNKCESKCKPSCKKSCCKPKCETGCKKSCCKPKCETGCKKSCCKPKCETGCKKSCCKPKCDTGCKKSCCKPKCETGCKKSCCEKKSCNSCAKPSCGGCEKPKCDPCKTVCACTDWKPYCGCEMIDSLCISLNTCDCEGGTAGPMQLELHGNDGKTIATIQLDGPIDGSASWNYKFAEPIKADSIREAVLINSTDDSATITWFSVTGMGECGWSYNYFDKKCKGITIGKDGCPRFVMF